MSAGHHQRTGSAESLKRALAAVALIDVFSVLSMAPYSYHMQVVLDTVDWTLTVTFYSSQTNHNEVFMVPYYTAIFMVPQDV